MEENNNIEFFINWLSNCFSTLNRFYNPSSFKKKTSNSYEYYRINDLDIPFCTDKIIDIIAKKSNIRKPGGRTVKEMKEFLEALLNKVDIVKERYEEINSGKEYIFKIRTKYIPNFLMNFLIESSTQNERTNEKGSIRLCDHNTGIGIDEAWKDIIDYMSFIESVQVIDIKVIKKILEELIEVLRAKSDNDELDFKALKRGFAKTLKKHLASINKIYFVSRIMYDENFEQKIENMLTDSTDTETKRVFSSVIMPTNNEIIKNIRQIFILIQAGKLELLTEHTDERYGSDMLAVTSPYFPMTGNTLKISGTKDSKSVSNIFRDESSGWLI